jgi:hypothetical protein
LYHFSAQIRAEKQGRTMYDTLQNQGLGHLPEATLEKHLSAHEKNSAERFSLLSEKLEGLKKSEYSKQLTTEKEGIKMGHEHESGVKVENIFKGDGMNAILPALLANKDHHGGLGGTGGALAGGLGGLLLGGLLGSNGNGGLFGGNNGGGSNVANVVENLAILNAIQSGQLANQAGFNGIEGAIATQSLGAATQASQYALAAQGQISGVKDSIQTLGSGLAVALGNVNQNVLVTAAQTAAAITADGDRTRSLITNQYEATLNRQLTEANLRLEGVERARGHDAINMRIDNSNTVTQAQAQTQMQFQMQQQGQLLNGLYPYILGTHQHAQATNANIIAGNTGAVTTGAQTSTPTNVNAR